MNKKIMAVLGSLGLIITTSSMVKAANVDITENMPKEGYVELDDNNHVIAASSPLLKEAAQQKNYSKYDYLFGSMKDRKFVKGGKFTCFSETLNYVTGYKASHSYFTHDTRRHYASAKVGNGKLVRSANTAPGKKASATAKGYGKAFAYYGYSD